MNCPRCGLNYFRPDNHGEWSCAACGHVPFDGQWLAIAVVTGLALAMLFSHAFLIAPIVF